MAESLQSQVQRLFNLSCVEDHDALMQLVINLRRLVGEFGAGPPPRWAKAQSDSVDGPGAPCADFVTVKECGDSCGSGVFGPPLTVQLPLRDGFKHRITSGDVLSFSEMPDRTFSILSDYTLTEGQVLPFTLISDFSSGSATAFVSSP